jgi:folate-binding protein YgfZ
MSPAAAIRLDRDVIRISGADAADYLQGQISQDVADLAPGSSVWSLILDPNGKVEAWVRVHRLSPDEFVVDLDAGYGEAALARLARFKLRSEVAMEPLDDWSMVSVRGEDAAEHPVEAELSAPVDWPGFEGVDHLGPQVEVPVGAMAMERDELEARRIAAGWPRMGAELTRETIPAEAGPRMIERSVCFTKRCYTGQELVARIDSRGGNVPRPIRLLVGPEGSELRTGATIRADGEDVGAVTSSAGVIPGRPGLALGWVLRRVAPDTRVLVGSVEATVHPLPN